LVSFSGILEREQEQSVVYGSIDFGKTVVTHTKYLDLLQKAGNQLKILPHKVPVPVEAFVLCAAYVILSVHLAALNDTYP
jgi:Clustered mitochondria